MIIDKIIFNTRKERKYVLCPNGHTTTIDFLLECYQYPHNDHNGVEHTLIGIDYYRLDNGTKTNVPHSGITHCPRCQGKEVTVKKLKKAKLSTKHTCNDKCQNAVSEECNCSCAGANHGINNTFSLQHSAEPL